MADDQPAGTTMTGSAGAVPPELLAMLDLDFGYSLLVKGEGGTGKTTLALELLVNVKEEGATFISTRVSPDQLFQQFPWIQEEASNISVLDATQSGTTFDNPLDGGNVALNFAGMPSFLRHVVSLAEQQPEKQHFIVLDSWDALQLLFEHSQALQHGAGKPQLTENLNFMYNAFMSLVREYNIKLILVAEDVSALEYLVDGVVELNRVFLEPGSKMVREIAFKKVRGIRITNSSYVFTLEHGRFCYLPPWDATFLQSFRFTPRYLVFDEPILRMIYDTVMTASPAMQLATITADPGSQEIIDTWIENLARLQVFREQLFTLMPGDSFDLISFKQKVLAYMNDLGIDEEQYFRRVQVYRFGEPPVGTALDKNVHYLPLPESGFFSEEDIGELLDVLQANLKRFMADHGFSRAINFGMLPALMSKMDRSLLSSSVANILYNKTVQLDNSIFVLAAFNSDHETMEALMKHSSTFIETRRRHGTPLVNVVVPYVRYLFGLKVVCQDGKQSFKILPVL